jgi:hypothetical protein
MIRPPQEPTDYTVRICVVIAGYFLLFLFYCLCTFPVLGWHGPACLCDDCIDHLDSEPARIEYLENTRRNAK